MSNDMTVKIPHEVGMKAAELYTRMLSSGEVAYTGPGSKLVSVTGAVNFFLNAALQQASAPAQRQLAPAKPVQPEEAPKVQRQRRSRNAPPPPLPPPQQVFYKAASQPKPVAPSPPAPVVKVRKKREATSWVSLPHSSYVPTPIPAPPDPVRSTPVPTAVVLKKPIGRPRKLVAQ